MIQRVSETFRIEPQVVEGFLREEENMAQIRALLAGEGLQKLVFMYQSPDKRTEVRRACAVGGTGARR